MESVFTDAETGGLGSLRFHHPPETFSPTPATRISLLTVGRHQALLRGKGLDWGCGIGCLGIAAARVPAVDQVLGLDIAAANVAAATENARRNGVESSTRFVVSDSYQPADERGRSMLEALRGNLDFILANPPASDGDDGFGFRRAVMIGARSLLHSGGVVFLSISQQYGPERIASLSKAPFSFRYRGLLESTDWVPFDLRRPDLMENIRGYAKTESEGGMLYQFRDATTGEDIDARTALSRYEDRGIHPLSKWQTHLLEAP